MLWWLSDAALQADDGTDAVGGAPISMIFDQPRPSRCGSHGPADSATASLACAKQRDSPALQSRTPARLVRRPMGPGDVTLVRRRPLDRKPQGLTLGHRSRWASDPSGRRQNLRIRADDPAWRTITGRRTALTSGLAGRLEERPRGRLPNPACQSACWPAGGRGGPRPTHLYLRVVPLLLPGSGTNHQPVRLRLFWGADREAVGVLRAVRCVRVNSTLSPVVRRSGDP